MGSRTDQRLDLENERWGAKEGKTSNTRGTPTETRRSRDTENGTECKKVKARQGQVKIGGGRGGVGQRSQELCTR